MKRSHNDLILSSCFRSALKSLSRKKGRTYLTILGITIGVCSVILIENISLMGSSAVYSELDSLGLSGLCISINNNSSPNVTLSEDELKIIKSIPHVSQATPIIIQNTTISSASNSFDSLIWGIDSKANQIVALNVLFGRSINNADVKACKNVCLVDQSFAKAVYNRENIVGKKIKIPYADSSDEFEIIGVIKTGTGLLQNIMGEYIPNFVYIPYTTMQNSSGRRSFDQIAVKVDDSKNVDAIGKQITKVLSRFAGVDDAFSANNLSKQKKGLTNLLNMVTMILSLIGVISLFVASLSIMTVMLVSVNERKREIGIKKSIGAKNTTILLEFLAEAFLLSLAGGIIGSVLATVLFYAGSVLLSIYYNIRFDVIILSILFSIITGVIFGVYPAYKASKLKPVDALRSE